jgi:hypothetical protein
LSAASAGNGLSQTAVGAWLLRKATSTLATWSRPTPPPLYWACARRTAVVDRLTFHAHIIQTGTDSRRLRVSRTAKN